ncbi:MAG: redox-sensing transcriptional repressor Rex [Anaerolineaceae bacterium]|jgi:redox-sensing transcriptional repressor|nr:redox-sensing transcriptional repressor Rex [Anaerolineaceae bacterium]MDI9531859.1 redox-sensing transcriptional repressor Rex [Chloroflexota bacterium]HOF29185.1 redox-sensing transcriptional repressor Rex [Anaerolineaceae bacterium]
MKRLTIPEVVVARLPLYTQKLNQLLREGRESVSSQEMADHLGITSAQFRKDISFFGGFGKQGTGYNVIKLLESLRSVLNLDRIWEVALVGVGRLGQALMSYHGFSSTGFEIVMAFDNDPEIIGKSIAGIKVLDVKEMQKQICHREIPIAILTVPAASAQEIADQMIACGVKAIMNYTPTTLKVPKGIRLANIDPVLSLQTITFYL